MNARLRRAAVVGGVALAATLLVTSLTGAATAGAKANRLGCDRTSRAKSWSFGVMGDTQWTVADDGKNPNTVPVDIIKQVNQQFIRQHVKFVVAVGDLCDDGSIAGEDTRAVFAQSLYNAGIGFYPLIGNHDDGYADAQEFTTIYPQTQSAVMNKTPDSAFAVTNPDAATQPFPKRAGKPFQIGTISTDAAAPVGWAGLDYAVNYRNVRLVFLDQFASSDPNDTSGHEALNDADVQWMNDQLSKRPGGTHAFVFGHKGIITENHTDTLFGKNPSVNPDLQNTFINDLQANGVRYYIGGHDHMNNRAIVSSPNGASSVEDVIIQSDSSKFYIPKNPTNDNVWDNPTRETQIAQQAVGPTADGATATVHVGYYIFHVCGPRVTVDCYSAPVTATNDGGEFLLATTPKLCFEKVDTFGYSLNGKQTIVDEGQSYAGISDSFQGTTVQLLGGTNDSTATDVAGRPLHETVDTGWNRAGRCSGLKSNVLTLWGLTDLGSDRTSTYALSMNYGSDSGRKSMLLTRDCGRWVNAVDANAGGRDRRVVGPWKADYKLGTWGVDPSTHTVWAVVNHDGKFAVGRECGR